MKYHRIIIITFFLLLCGCARDPGYNTPVFEVPDYHQEIKAISFTRNIGVGSSILAMVSIVPIEEKLDSDHLGNIFRGKNLKIIGLKWEDKTLHIEYSGSDEDIALQVIRYYGYMITYDRR